MTLDPGFFERGVEQVARALIGATIAHDGVGGTIVETEAYDSDDPASHSFKGPTARNAMMFGPAGRAYVYRIYGLHWCLNISCGNGSAALLRAIEPTVGLDAMVARRGLATPRLLCAGPGRLCQALAIDGSRDGLAIDAPPFTLALGPQVGNIVAGPRIGVSQGRTTPWRFCLLGSPYLSRPVPDPR